jgi:hypothetical protein
VLMLANEQLESELEELRAAMATGGTLQCRIDQSLHYRPVAALVIALKKSLVVTVRFSPI